MCLKVMKPKPLDLPVALSVMTAPSSISPNSSYACNKSQPTRHLLALNVSQAQEAPVLKQLATVAIDSVMQLPDARLECIFKIGKHVL